MASENPRLDHIILLLPYDALLNPPSWLTENFTITPGGRHNDGKTENKLICFEDGSYIELIAFIDDSPSHREGHWWGKKGFGIVDFALTHASFDATFFYSELQKNLQALKPSLHVNYKRPVLGGRVRPDQTEVKWAVTFPDEGVQRGEVPFFCHDVTPRLLRVPSTKEFMTHPSGVYGIKELSIFIPKASFHGLQQVYTALFNNPDCIAASVDSPAIFDVDRVCRVDGAKPVRIRLQEPTDDWQVRGLKEEGEDVFIGELIMASHRSDLAQGRTDLKASGSARVLVENDRSWMRQ